MAKHAPVLLQRNITVTEGAADAFVQVTDPTAISASAKIAWLIKRISVMFDLDVLLENVSADFAIAWGVARASDTSVPSLDDKDTIYANGISGSLTTSGQILIPKLFEWDAPGEGLLMVDPQLFYTLDSTATGLVLSADFRVVYEEVSLSELEILRLISN